MKLSAPFHLRQLLSLIGVFCIIHFSLFAQAPAPAAAATGPDYLELSQPPNKVLKNVLILEVKGNNVMVREAIGDLGYPLSAIKEVRKEAPPDFIKAQQLIEAGQFEQALPLTKAVVDKYKGLKTIWAQDATAMLGNLYLSLNKLDAVEYAFAELEKAYPSAAVSASLGRARLAAARKDFTTARSAAQPIVADALSKKNVTRTESQVYGMAYFILGQAAEGQGKLPEAMEDYCRTVAIFYHERSVVAEAQKRVDELRSKGISVP